MEDYEYDTENGNCTGLKDYQKSVIQWVVLGCGSVSLICCLLVLATIAVFKKVRTTSQRLVLYLVLGVFAYSAVYILHGVEDRKALEGINGGYCIAMGFLDQLLSWVEPLALLCLTFDMFIKIRTMDFRATVKYEKFYILIIFALPLVFNWIPFTTGSYGESGAYCWIRSLRWQNGTCDTDTYGIAYQFALFWVPFYIVMIAIIVIYSWAICKARVWLKYQALYDPHSQGMREKLVSELWQYMLYPLIIMIINIVPLVSRMVLAIHAEQQKSFYELEMMHGIFVNLDGPGLALVFFVNSETRKDLGSYVMVKKALFEFFCCCQQPRVQPYKMIVDKDTDSLVKSGKHKIASYNTITTANDRSFVEERSTDFSS